MSRGSLARWAVRVCELGSTSWLVGSRYGRRPNPTPNPNPNPNPNPDPNPGRKRSCPAFQIFFIIPICGPPHSPRPMREREKHPPRSARHTTRNAAFLSRYIENAFSQFPHHTENVPRRFSSTSIDNVLSYFSRDIDNVLNFSRSQRERSHKFLVTSATFLRVSRHNESHCVVALTSVRTNGIHSPLARGGSYEPRRSAPLLGWGSWARSCG